jgi:hypothetical protein
MRQVFRQARGGNQPLLDPIGLCNTIRAGETMPLRLGPLFSLLCAVAGVANARNAVQVASPNGQIVSFLFAASGEQVAIVYSVTFGSKGDRCTRLPPRLSGKVARDLDRNS